MTKEPGEHLLTRREYHECKIACNRLRRHEAAARLVKIGGFGRDLKASQRRDLRAKIHRHTLQIQTHKRKLAALKPSGGVT
jgi:hypothetical protein